MGVVRRKDDWRLEKREEGLYEITYQKESQMMVLTENYTPGMMDNPHLDAIPVREVGSYSEVEGLFEEMAHGDPPFGGGSFGTGEPMSIDTDLGGALDSGSEINGEDIDLPPGGFAIVLIATGGITLSVVGINMSSILFIASIAMILGGLAIFGWAGILYREEGWSEAFEFLTSSDESDTSSTTDDEPETTPPASEKLKNKLIFDRANQKCEWCEESFDHPHVHHIQPRREGGPNTPSNLIVLCPNCHEKADREAIPRSKLKAKVRRQPEITTS